MMNGVVFLYGSQLIKTFFLLHIIFLDQLLQLMRNNMHIRHSKYCNMAHY